VKIFWEDGLVQEFFSYAYALGGYVFKSFQNPKNSQKKLNFVLPNTENEQQCHRKVPLKGPHFISISHTV